MVLCLIICNFIRSLVNDCTFLTWDQIILDEKRVHLHVSASDYSHKIVFGIEIVFHKHVQSVLAAKQGIFLTQIFYCYGSFEGQ